MAIYAARRPAPSDDHLDLVFNALANPTRRKMLEHLATGVRSVNELAKPFKMRQPSITKHLQVLERAGLVERGQDAQWRPRTLRTGPLRDANVYLERFRKLWDARLDRLDRFLKSSDR